MPGSALNVNLRVLPEEEGRFRRELVARVFEDVIVHEAWTGPGTSASVTFPTSGTVASVRAVLGAHVTAGQQLAALDETSLRTAVASATASVAHARLTLYQAENGQTSSTGASTSGRSAGAGSSGTGSGSTSGSGAGSGGTSGSGSAASTAGRGSGMFLFSDVETLAHHDPLTLPWMTTHGEVRIDVPPR